MTPQPKPAPRGPKAPKRIARTTKPRKRRATTLAGLKRKLWKLFARYVKDRDGNTCVTCGKTPLVGADWQAGHWISRRIHSTLFHPLNCASQCSFDNLYRRGAPHLFADYLLVKYGQEQVRALVRRSTVIHQWKKHELEALIAAIQKSGADYEIAYSELELW